ncbi:MAG: ATP-dependent Clp protease ATP-binding subunit ClpC, partial [Bacteroidota bacterium]
QQGYDPVFGARPLKRVIQRALANQLAEQILAGFVREGDAVKVDASADGAGVTLETVPAGTGVEGTPLSNGDGATGDPEVRRPGIQPNAPTAQA